MKRENYQLIKALRHELHAHPELSHQEVWTRARLIAFLREHTSLEIVEHDQWFYAIHREEGADVNLAFRADIDALPIHEELDIPHCSKIPGVSHKCGHDGHAAALCGLGLELEGVKTGKNIFLLFQHAEETGSGAIEAVRFIHDEGIDEIFSYHNEAGIPLGQIRYKYGTSHYASKGMIIEMVGRPTHASAPEFGKNPAYALSQLVMDLQALDPQEMFEGEVLWTVIQLDVGEPAFGTAASSGKLLLTIRAELERELDELQDMIEAQAAELAEGEELKYSFSYQDEFPETVSHDSSVDKIREAAKRLGYDAVEGPADRGSEDFGYYLKATKGAMFNVGNGEDSKPLHTWEYDFTDEVMVYAVEMFKTLIAL
ncbi:MAG: amidohydrolase [Tissierellia bacterium]|nr:amidohydrolase [Bacillota bacterium]NLL23288.1 amidohydrolase [Tissierellia bacterium]